MRPRVARRALREAQQKVHIGPRDEALIATLPRLASAAAPNSEETGATFKSRALACQKRLLGRTGDRPGGLALDGGAAAV